jgi:sorbitol/mannitol transport system permease protein
MLITPFLVMPVATALLFKTTIFDPIFGLLDWVLSPFGVHQVNWVGIHSVAAVVLVLVWEWTPFMMLIVLAGLQSESLEALEAARVDGASTVQTFIWITLPYLRRYIELGMLLGSIYVLQAFGEIFILTQGGGGDGTATTNLPYYIYELAFNSFNVSEAAAAGVIVVIATEIVATLTLRLLSGLFAASEAMG